MVDPARSSKVGWLVRTHYVMRSASFATVFAASCIHIAGRGYGPCAWAYLIGLLLVYPQIQYWRARRSSEPVATVMNALLLDSVLLGAFCATVQFSDWLTFSVMLGTLSNSAANKGWRNMGQTLLALAGGALAGVALGGLHFSPATGWQAALFCIVGLGAYVLAVGNITFSRNTQLRVVREQLRLRERELMEANATLHHSLAEIEALRKGLVEQANKDGLTELFNRRYLDSALERELARCKRESMPLALIMVDIDHFKKYNDCYGHQAGDECLKVVARALQASAKRASDLAARYGGEEFSLVLPYTDEADAQRMAEALRREVESLAIPHAQSDAGIVTISAGLAVMSEHGYAHAEQLLRAADDALYYAKWGGRNRVHVAPQPRAQHDAPGPMPAGLLQLSWHPSYASGNADIDAQHKQLFSQINALHSAIRDELPTGEVVLLIDHLMRSVVAHFDLEEVVLHSIGFPHADAHAASHRALMQRAVNHVSLYRNGQLTLSAMLEVLVSDLIVNHVLDADRSYFSSLPGR